MAIDRDIINITYFKGWADTRPEGSNRRDLIGYSNPYETWPEELKEEFAYNPQRAEEFLDEAGYPRGADGIRFYDAMVDAMLAATTIEEQKRHYREADMYIIKNHWVIAGPRPPMFNAVQPWLMGYNGENDLGTTEVPLIFTRLWIDQDLKQEMGH